MMRVRINNQPTAKQKKVLRQECKKEFFNLLEMYNRQVALQIMHILHFDYGFGEKRLYQFFVKLKQMQARNIERYDVVDDDVPDICEIQLRDAGIDFNKIFEA
ncbi:MAG: hypothetical protein U0M60_17650 [Clostridia bacterium]|nr:hypothetical protein [Clostridia bacterium]